MYRLIIADDEESIRNGIAHSLPWQEWGYEVCALCSDGQEVLEQLKLVHPDVVLSNGWRRAYAAAEQRLPRCKDRDPERLQRF